MAGGLAARGRGYLDMSRFEGKCQDVHACLGPPPPSQPKPNGAFTALSYGSKDKGYKTCCMIFINLPQIPRAFMRKTREGNTVLVRLRRVITLQTMEVGQDDDRLLAESLSPPDSAPADRGLGNS